MANITLCGACAKPFEAKRRDAKTCSSACRQRLARGQVGVTHVPSEAGRNVERSRAALEAAGRLDTWQGAAAMSIAERIDEATAVMGYAALVKEHREAMEFALKGAQAKSDPVDELRAARDAKYRAG